LVLIVKVILILIVIVLLILIVILDTDNLVAFNYYLVDLKKSRVSIYNNKILRFSVFYFETST